MSGTTTPAAAPASWLLFATEAEALKAARQILEAMGSDEANAYPVSQPGQSTAPAGWVLPNVDDAFLGQVRGHTRVASVTLAAGAGEPMLRAPAKARTADVRALLKSMPGTGGKNMLQNVLNDMAADENDTQDAAAETTFDRTRSPIAVSLRKLGMTEAAMTKLLADANNGHATRVGARSEKIKKGV